VTDERALMMWLESGDPSVRLSAQADLAKWLREERDPVRALTRGMGLAPYAVTERQWRSYSALLADIATAQTSILLIVAGDSEEIHGTVARRAFRRFFDHALPPDEAAALSQALEWCDVNRASAQLVVFLCERVLEAAVKCPTLELRSVQTTLEKLVARKTLRRAFGRAWMIQHFEETLASLKPLLPAATLPLPSHGSPSESSDNLPRPAKNRENDAENLPRPWTPGRRKP
jgi:hypothetical protein